jgi:hypothetical protein
MSINIDTVITFTRQNTGKHFLDSGFENGRVWQHPAPESMFHVDTDGWVSMSLTHVLAENATTVGDIQEAIEQALADNDNLTWFESGPHVMEERGFTCSARDNTYNSDNDYDQNFVWEVWQRESGRDWVWDTDAVVLVYVHTGADARGGYARPVAVRFDGDAVIPLDPFVSFVPADDHDDDTYEREQGQSRLRDDYPTFVKYDKETQTLTLATKDGEERDFLFHFWI